MIKSLLKPGPNITTATTTTTNKKVNANSQPGNTNRDQ